VPVAHGNDGGGSIRIPAACCGLVGLKPARGRVSLGPFEAQSFLVVDGVLSRTVADTAHVLDILAGYEPGDANWAPPPPDRYAELAVRGPDSMRIGLALEPPLRDVTLHPTCEAAARDAATLLESLGHTVEPIAPPWLDMDLLSEFTRAFGPAVSTTTMIGGRLAGRDPAETDVEPLTWAMWEHARDLGTMSFLSAHARLESAARTIVASLEPYDALLTPALAERPVPIGELHGCGPDPWEHYQRSAYFTPFTSIANITGLPAISLPLYQGDDGLPTAVQLIGRPAREEALLALATQLERALPWADRRPDLAR
jgi:amidase